VHSTAQFKVCKIGKWESCLCTNTIVLSHALLSHDN
jgi:hypothetical protein